MPLVNTNKKDKMKILHLTLKKKWFDMIASGEKKRITGKLKSIGYSG
jgi:hypothetical protein